METDALDVDVDARSVARDGDDGTSDARVAEALTRVTTVTTSTREGDANNFVSSIGGGGRVASTSRSRR